MPYKRSRTRSSRAVSRSDSFKRAKTLPYASRVPRIPRTIGNGPVFDPTPASIKVRLRFCKQITMSYSPTSGNVVWDSVQVNKCRTALGFNTYSALYNKYRVITSHCEVTPINNQDKGILMVIKEPTNELYSQATSLSLIQAMTKKYCTWALPSQLRNGGKRSVTSYWSMNENREMINDQYTDTDVTGDPEQDVYFAIGYASYQTDQITCIVNVTYDVEFSDRKMVT